MKVATLFYGQPRYLDNPLPLEAYNRELFSKYHCTNFFHTWWGRDIKEYDKSTWVSSSIYPDPSAVTKIIEKYEPHSLLVENPRHFDIHEDFKKFVEEKFNYNELNMNNIFSHLYSISTVSNLVKNSGIEYDWYVLARTDMVIRNVPDLWNVSPDKLYLPNNHSNFPDTAVIFGPKFLTWACSLFEEMDLPSVYEKIQEPTAESFKMEVFKFYHNLNDLVPCGIYGDVIRSNR